MKHIQDLDFMKLANVFALHEFWTNNDAGRKQLYVVHSQREADNVKVTNTNSEVLSLAQISDIPMAGSNVEIYLSRTVVAILLYQGKSAIEYLLAHLDGTIKSMSRFQNEMQVKLRKEEDAHTNTAQNFRDQLNLVNNKLQHMEKTAEILAGEIKKYELLTNSEKSKKKKDLIDKLCDENESLKRKNETLEAQLGAYRHDEDLT